MLFGHPDQSGYFVNQSSAFAFISQQLASQPGRRTLVAARPPLIHGVVEPQCQLLDGTTVQLIQRMQTLGQMTRVMIAAMRLLPAHQQLGTQPAQLREPLVPSARQMIDLHSNHLEPPATHSTESGCDHQTDEGPDDEALGSSLATGLQLRVTPDPLDGQRYRDAFRKAC